MVRPDDELAVAVAAAPGGLAHLPARALLGLRRHRILQVEDQGVGRQRLGPFSSARAFEPGI
jgi:hypothetical protein